MCQMWLAGFDGGGLDDEGNRAERRTSEARRSEGEQCTSSVQL